MPDEDEDVAEEVLLVVCELVEEAGVWDVIDVDVWLVVSEDGEGDDKVEDVVDG